MPKGVKTSGAFKKGNPGRPKGATNPIKKQLREALTDGFNTDMVDKLFKEMNTLKGLSYVKACGEVLPYILPKLQNVSFTDKDGNESNELTIRIVRPDGTK
jgi:hypothetical protein